MNADLEVRVARLEHALHRLTLDLEQLAADIRKALR